MSVPPASWADLPPPWQNAVELAWNAYGKETTPVGAVIVDEDGREISRGMNARHACGGDAAPLAGSHIAHAELIALSRLSSEDSYPGYTLYSTLEPCLLCVGAAVMSTIGCVRWAGVDPYGGATSQADDRNAHLRRRLTRFAGPDDGALGTFCAGLHAEFYLRRDPDGVVVTAYREEAPEAVRTAGELAALDAPATAAGGSHPASLFDRLAAASAGRERRLP
ncbi:MAG TPA: nucleoside deaminase [Gaiellales bacterium]|jgi:tRNA(Arg) A34 adenosine deaminase TadA|nr:nucleoside deaminase [Gaiellales bacterium]